MARTDATVPGGSRSRAGVTSDVELWAGIECTVNRVHDTWHDQLERSGHAARLDDLDRVAALGIRTLRYPVLWERTAPYGLGDVNFGWADERLARLRALGVRPIVGLVHHGSGPRDTSLVHPEFAPRLASYAAAVAQRYPWVKSWTPVNEPLTTARFSGLYGHWYPHGRDTRTFLRALVNQCRGVVLAMRAIRAAVPDARLVQTEDVGTIHASADLAHQAEYENQRRWLSLDLLTGRIDERHPLRRHLAAEGVAPRELDFFCEHPCPPDVIGINYYATSDRLLDSDRARWPSGTHGGNGRDRYADVEAVRAWGAGITGHRALLDLVWRRYGLPVALTEVHLGCSRDEQVRWLVEAWHGAREARDAGCDVRALTVWALFGTHDWDGLAVGCTGSYEPGAFDVRDGRPRPTAIAAAVRGLATLGTWDHPVLDTPGWWRRPSRLHVPPMPDNVLVADPAVRTRWPRPLVILGATGTLGGAFGRICAQREWSHRLLSRHDMDIANAATVGRVLDTIRPWAVINAAGYVRVDDADQESERCHRENALGPAILAAACADRGVRLVTFSSDLVFDGMNRRPYVESDPVSPLCVYGESKVAAERRVSALWPSALIVRTSAFFGPWDAFNFVTQTLASLAAGRPVRAAGDTVVSPTYVPDLVHATLDLLVDDERGIWHVANTGAVTWAELARRAASSAGLNAALIEECDHAALGCTARRPRFTALACERGLEMPPLDTSIWRYVRERKPVLQVAS
jgi:dTDP-4-dehydrorhamnose reductase